MSSCEQRSQHRLAHEIIQGFDSMLDALNLQRQSSGLSEFVDRRERQLLSLAEGYNHPIVRTF